MTVQNNLRDCGVPLLEDNDELSSVELQRSVARKFAVEFSPPTIRRYLHTTLEWTIVRTRFDLMTTENKMKCVEFARMCIDTMMTTTMLYG